MGAGGAVLILVPLLISGYLFNLIFYPFRYFSSRAEGQKLFFMAAGSGLVLGASVFFITGQVAYADWFTGGVLHRIALAIDRSLPVPHACRLLATIFSAVLLAAFLNGLLWIRYGSRGRPTGKRVYNKLTDAFGNPLSQLLRKAADKQTLVMLNLKSRKIYCGRILEVPPDIESDDACIEILPSFSGYRDKDTLRMGREKTNYPVIDLWEARQFIFSRRQFLKFFDEIERSASAALREEIRVERAEVEADIRGAEEIVNSFGEPVAFEPTDWVKVIPVREIESASFYDPDAYESWFGAEEPADKQVAASAGDGTE